MWVNISLWTVVNFSLVNHATAECQCANDSCIKKYSQQSMSGSYIKTVIFTLKSKCGLPLARYLCYGTNTGCTKAPFELVKVYIVFFRYTYDISAF